MSWRAISAIARKDMLDAIKNLYILSALVLPIVMSLLFRVAFAGPSQALGSTAVVFDPGGSSLSAALRAVPDYNVVDAPSLEALPGEVERQAVAGLAIPDDFDATLQAGGKPELAVYINRGRGGGEIAAFYLLLDQRIRTLAGQASPVEMEVTDVGQSAVPEMLRSLNYEVFLLVVLLVLSVTMAGIFAVPTLLVEEKERHTLEVLLVSPASAADVAIGKGLVGLTYCVLGSLALILLNRGWQGSWPLTVGSLLVGSAFAVLVGLLIGGIFRTTSQVNTWASLVLMILILPTWFVSIGSSSPITVVLHLIPTFYLTEALGATLAGDPDLGRLALDMAILGVCSAVALAGVVWILRREDR